jgi:hypothetical protein
MLTALALLCSIETTDCRQLAEAPDQSELPFMCLQYDIEEAAKHPVPDGKFVKVACVHKNVPRIIKLVAALAALLVSVGAGAWCIGMAIYNNEALAQHDAPPPEAIYYDDGYVDGLARALGYDSVEQMARAGRPRPPRNVAHR